MAEMSKFADSSMFFIVFWLFVVIVFGWLCDRFLIEFVMNFGWFLEVKMSKNSFKNDLKKWSKIRCILGWHFGGSWRGLGCHFGVKVGPRWFQEGLRCLQEGLRWLQDGLRCPKILPRRLQDAPKYFQEASKMAQDASKMPQDVPRCPKMLPRCPKIPPRCLPDSPQKLEKY